jgi:hypothetical protein
VQLWQNIIGSVIHVAHEFDQQWQKRQRVLNSLLIMLFIFRLVFSTNKQGYAITTVELWEQCRTLGIDLPQPTPLAHRLFVVRVPNWMKWCLKNSRFGYFNKPSQTPPVNGKGIAYWLSMDQK